MEPGSQKIDVNIEDEMKTSYIDYAMSVIIGRALPDVRDGLKPVHRRALYGMYELKNNWNGPYKKSARIVGEVMGKYHPHGDQSIYDAMVRLAQPFSMRYMLVDGQGNFGSVDGDPPAAMRYTEVRMARLAHELLADLEKETVDFGDNYDGSEQEPLVLPNKVPNLLLNGSEGIAVGMATKIPPHNLRELITATIHLIRDPAATVDDLMGIVQGPDFPTGAFILGTRGITDAYRTGRGIVQMRAKHHLEEKSNGESIIFDELPFQVNKARLLERIADLVKDKRIEGIRDLRDESDRRGMRMVVELKRDAIADVVLNQLFKMTPLQTSFGVILLAIVRGRPLTLTLKDCLRHFIDHRREVVTRRCLYELRRAEARAHILEGLLIALDNIDAIVETIKGSPDPPTAKQRLAERFGLSDLQAQAILDMRLQRLTGLERDKIRAEYDELKAEIERLQAILDDDGLLLDLIIGELEEIEERYGDDRRTEILPFEGDIDDESLIPEERMVVTVSNQGYIKRVALSEYSAQRRGGKGKASMRTKDEDFVRDLFVASTHSHILIFTDLGRVFRLKVWQLPQGSRTARGKAVVNLIDLMEGEQMTALRPVAEWPEAPDEKFLFFCTEKGRVKKTDLTSYQNIRSNGLYAIELEDDDHLIEVRQVDPGQHVLMVSADGMAIRFNSDEARPMGRRTRGVRGMSLRPGDHVVGMLPVRDDDGDLLTATERGYGKRTPLSDYRAQKRAGLGLKDIKTEGRNGKVIGARSVTDEDEMIFVTDAGTLIRIGCEEVRQVGRNTKGVILIRVDDDENLVGMAKAPHEEEDEESGDDGEGDRTEATEDAPAHAPDEAADADADGEEE